MEDFKAILLKAFCQAFSRKSVKHASSRPFPSSDLIKSLLNVGDKVIRILDTAGEANQVGCNSACDKVGIGKLTVGSGRGVETAGARIRNVCLDCDHFK